MHPAYAVLLGLFLLALVARYVYETFRSSGRAPRGKYLAVALVFGSMCVMWVSWFCMCSLDPLRVVVPPSARWGGLILLGIGFILAIGALSQLQGFESPRRLITHGFFAVVRHPMYLGFIFWIFGWGLYHGAVLSLIFGLVGVANILYWRRLEERGLEARFGDAYRVYRSRTLF